MLIPAAASYYDATGDEQFLKGIIDDLVAEYEFWHKHRYDDVK